MSTKKVEDMVMIGGKEWKAGDKHRIYFQGKALEALLGLKVERYGTGNLCSAFLEGEKISNTAAKKILGRCAEKVFYDVKKDAFDGVEIEYVKKEYR